MAIMDYETGIKHTPEVRSEDNILSSMTKVKVKVKVNRRNISIAIADAC